MTLEWPPHLERTPVSERTKNNRFEATLRESIDDLDDELGRVGVDNWRLSTAAEHQKREPRYPYANATPDDPGAVVRWTKDGGQYAAACDAYSRLRDNIRSLYLYIQETRKMETRPVVTGESEFAKCALPSGSQQPVVADTSPHEVLGVSSTPDPAEVRRAFKDRVKESHPDRGGSDEEIQRIYDARDKLLNST